ncbi:MAG TPA: glutaredoxin domain-containing protein [Candidatus Saccharimonadales bacterium]|jgi:glutaredoxin-like YruB-family protein|nr:glutaredoxin domain-containing protein [Candidatus Saccharimonadales bacterium]
MSEERVTIYSASWCAYCYAVKEYLNKKGIKFTDKDIDIDPTAAGESVKKSGQRGIPVVDINGSIIVGFDRDKIDHALKVAHLS